MTDSRNDPVEADELDPDEEFDLDDDLDDAIEEDFDLLDSVAEALELTVDEKSAVAAFAMWSTLLHTADHSEAERPDESVISSTLVPHLDALADPTVAEALRIVAVHGDRHDGGYLADVVRPLLGAAPRKALPSLHWLLGHVADLNNDVDAAESEFERVVDWQPQHPLAINDLAAIRSERGDAVGALSLLTRIGEDADEDLLALVDQYQPTERSDLGRNDPCFCGSGKKYKVCHLRRAEFTLAERVDWLYEKVAYRLRRNEFGAGIAALAELRGDYMPGEDEDAAVDAAMDDPLVADINMFEGGGLRSYLSERGHVLPDDEFDLASRWLDSKRSLFEVTAEGLREVRSGSLVSTTVDLVVGALVCARPLDSGSGLTVLWAEPVPEPLRDPVLKVLDDDPDDPANVLDVLSLRLELFPD